MKTIIVCTLVIAASLAEPPVNNRYLPPQQRFNGALAAPSQSYGAPFGVQRHTDAVFGNRPSSSYGTPSFGSRSNRPSTQYGTPRSSSQTPSTQYLPSRNQAPSTQYLPSTNQAPSSQYGAPRSSYQAQSQSSSRNYQAPSSQYGAPSNFQAPSSQYGAPEIQAPSSFGQPSNQYGAPGLARTAPSQQYGTPEFGGNQYSQELGAGSSFRGVDRAYLPPSARNGGYAGDDANSEPANYNFEYMVKDDESGNDFGHREARQGDRAEGLYYVLLPDGRKQTVEYEADENGYKPRISYEDTGLVSGGYNRNGQSGYQDYQNQGGPY